MKMLKSLDFKLLSELVKDAKKSDREIAKKIGVSQPTITRRRAMLEKELSLNYTTIPDWSKLGYDILALTFAKWKHRMFPDERVPQAREFLQKHPNIIFCSTSQGIGSDRACISLHKNYRDFNRFVGELRQDWGKYMDNLNSFIISFGADNVLRPITLKFLANYLQEQQ